MTEALSRFARWYRQFIQGKTRILFAWAFSIVLVFSARDFPHWSGILICFLGATLRFWASGYLFKNNRLTVSGPYRYTRNPLFLGTFFMALGTALAVQSLALTAVAVLTFFGIYHINIQVEEENLKKIFGSDYQEYSRQVPRYFPLPWQYLGSSTEHFSSQVTEQPFSWQVAYQNKAYEAYAAFLGLIGAMYLLAFVWQNLF